MQRNLFSEFACFAPDEGGGAAGNSSPAVPPATPPSPAAPTEPTPDPTSPAASPPTTQPAVAGSPDATPAAPAAPSWLDSLRKDNPTLVGKDEAETFANIKRIAEERQLLEALRPMIPTLRQYQSEAAKYQEWKAAQQKQQAPAQAANKPSWDQFWKAPEFDKAWMQHVTKDANGNLVPVAGAPPGIVDKIQNYVAYQQEEMRKFTENPHAYMEGFIDQRATEIATRLYQQNHGQAQQAQQASQFIEQNSGWLFEVDASTGRPRQQIGIDPITGQQVAVPLLSEWGKKFKSYAEDEFKEQQRRGYHDDARIQKYAFEMVQKDFAIHQLQNQQPAAPAAPAAPQKTAQEIANEKFLAKNNPPGARQPGGGNTTPADVKVTRRNISEIMRQGFAEAGITDQTIANAR